jgi:hypothetical protein
LFLRFFDVVLAVQLDECEHDSGEKENISTIDAADSRALIKVYVVIRFIFSSSSFFFFGRWQINGRLFLLLLIEFQKRCSMIFNVSIVIGSDFDGCWMSFADLLMFVAKMTFFCFSLFSRWTYS